MAFITLTQLGSDRKVALSIDAIGYFRETATGSTLIFIGAGEEGQLIVTDSFSSIMDLLKDMGEAGDY